MAPHRTRALAVLGAGGTDGTVDCDPAYKTLATGPSGRRAVYTGYDDSHTWTLVGAPAADEAGRGLSALVQIALVVAALLIIAVAGVLAARRLRRLRRRQVTA